MTPFSQVILDPMVWKEKFFAWWKSSICKIVLVLWNNKTFEMSIFPHACISHRPLPTSQCMYKQKIKGTCKKTVLWNEPFVILTEHLLWCRWCTMNVTAIYHPKSILEKRPELWIDAETIWRWSWCSRQIHIFAVEWIWGKNKQNAFEIAVIIVTVRLWIVYKQNNSSDHEIVSLVLWNCLPRCQMVRPVTQA